MGLGSFRRAGLSIHSRQSGYTAVIRLASWSTLDDMVRCSSGHCLAGAWTGEESHGGSGAELGFKVMPAVASVWVTGFNSGSCWADWHAGGWIDGWTSWGPGGYLLTKGAGEDKWLEHLHGHQCSLHMSELRLDRRP